MADCSDRTLKDHDFMEVLWQNLHSGKSNESRDHGGKSGNFFKKSGKKGVWVM